MAGKRFDSLIPLSREHHYALIVCLRIHRGVPKHLADAEWLKAQARKAIRFFETTLPTHFQAEETLLFPVMRDLNEASPLVTTLLEEHRQIHAGVERLEELQAMGETSALASALLEWADLLEAHIRREERQLFPLYQEKVAPEVDAKLGQEIMKLIGTAMKPKHPELLQ